MYVCTYVSMYIHIHIFCCVKSPRERSCTRFLDRCRVLSVECSSLSWDRKAPAEVEKNTNDSNPASTMSTRSTVRAITVAASTATIKANTIRTNTTATTAPPTTTIATASTTLLLRRRDGTEMVPAVRHQMPQVRSSTSRTHPDIWWARTSQRPASLLPEHYTGLQCVGSSAAIEAF